MIHTIKVVSPVCYEGSRAKDVFQKRWGVVQTFKAISASVALFGGTHCSSH